MSQRIEFAKNLDFSTDIITEVIDIVARRGSGKTYTATKLAEGMLKVGAQVVVLDPVGNWYGLRLGSKGQAEGGLDIKIFGGRKGDIPLEHTAGRLIAKTIVATGISVILDLTKMKKDEQCQFVTEFSEAILEERQEHPAAMHIYWEEAYRFMPQKIRKGAKSSMLEATEELVTMGRNFGIGHTIVCQRAAQVSKTCLTQASILVAMNTMSVDRKIILEWIDHKGMDPETKEATKLEELGTGQAYVWWPEEFGIRKVKVAKKFTYDVKAAKFGDKAKHTKLKPIDMGALEVSMAATIEKAKSEDPKLLQRRIAELERKLSAADNARPKTVEVEVEVNVVDDDTIEELRQLGARMEHSAREISEALGRVAKPTGVQTGNPITTARSAATERAPLPGAFSPVPRSPRTVTPPSDVSLKTSARRVLQVFAAVSPGGLTKKQAATGAILKSTTGSFTTYWSSLKNQSLITESDDRWCITEEGLAYLGKDVPVRPSDPEELLGFWCERLKTSAGSILRHMFSRPAESFTKSELGEAVGLKHTTGSFTTYMSSLTSNNLAVKDSAGRYQVGEDLR